MLLLSSRFLPFLVPVVRIRRQKEGKGRSLWNGYEIMYDLIY
jgi:hypothetical protein